MHALPIKPSRIFYRREQEKKEDHLAHVSPKSPPKGPLRPASPTKKPSVLTARTPSDTLQVGFGGGSWVWAVGWDSCNYL